MARDLLVGMNTLEVICSWEADSPSAGQEITNLLRNLTFHYRVHKSPALHPVLSQINPLHTLIPFCLKINCNTVLPSTPRSSKSFFPFRLPLPNACYMTARLVICDLMETTITPCMLHVQHVLSFWVQLPWQYSVKGTSYGTLAFCYFVCPTSKYLQQFVHKHPNSVRYNITETGYPNLETGYILGLLELVKGNSVIGEEH
jgi:hypothetical protein